MLKVYDLSNEDLVIRKFFEDNSLQHRIAPHLDSALFEDDHNRKICEWINRFQKANNRYPGAQELITALPACSQRSKLINICNADIQPMERNFVVDMLEKFFKERKTKKVLVDAAEAIHDRDFTNIASIIKELQDSVNFNMNLDVGIDVVEDTPEALRRLNETLRAIPSALADVRRFTSTGSGYGGHYRKALSIFLGMPNVGKSIVLCNEAAFAYQKGYNVLYVTLEMSEELIWERIASNVTNISLGEVRATSAEDIQRLLQTVPDVDTHSVGNLVVKALPTTATVVDIENEIIEVKRTKGFDIDLLVVDYIGIMKPSKRSTSVAAHSLYTMGKEIAEQLRDLAKAREIAVVTASQMNRDGYSNKEASMQHVAGSAGLNDTADFMMTINQPPEMKPFALFSHNILKNRFGPNTINSISKVDYSHMRVRTASEDDMRAYSEAQLSSGGEVETFSPRSDKDGSDLAPSKRRDDIEAQRKKMEELRAPTVKTGNDVNKGSEETILVNTDSSKQNHGDSGSPF